MILNTNASTQEKLHILSDAAKYDVACTSSGVSREGRKGEIGNSVSCGICHSFSSDGRCISLLKVLFTNECIYDCKYCINRKSNDVPRACFEPDELAKLTMDFYRRNYIEGLFLSSGVITSPNYTMEQIIYCLRLLREKYHFNGYIHCKSIPGADPYLVEEAGWLADRMSVNLELPTAESLKQLAPNKTRQSILSPIRQIQLGIDESREEFGLMGGNRSSFYYTQLKVEEKQRARLADIDEGISADFSDINRDILPNIPERNTSCAAPSSHISLKDYVSGGHPNANTNIQLPAPSKESRPSVLTQKNRFDGTRGFVAGGQSTQMIIGATPETDYNIISVTEALYRRFDLKRVFFSAFINLGTDSSLPLTPDGPALLREHRLYQADFLMRNYGFESRELLSEQRPNFNEFLDPKCDWALANPDIYPVEISKADYLTLLRVPGIGPKSARRIITARRYGTISFEDLKKMGVVLKRAVYFITCYGKLMYNFNFNVDTISRYLAGIERPSLPLLDDGITYKQLSLFDDLHATQ